MSEARPLPGADLPARYPISRRLLLGTTVSGAAGLLLTLVGMLVSPRPALLAYLVAYVYWLGLAIGAVTLVLAHHTTGAKWHVSLRRFNEDVKEGSAGFECGILLQNFQDLREGDVLETYETRKVERELS